MAMRRCSHLVLVGVLGGSFAVVGGSTPASAKGCSTGPNWAHVSNPVELPPGCADEAAYAVQGCPYPQPLASTSRASKRDIRAAAREGVRAYFPNARSEGFYLWKVQTAAESVWGGYVYAECGATVGKRTWVVQAVVDRDPASANAEIDGVLVSRFENGWRAWEQLHL
jgi:hypothetical protein